jgi:DsbC/DsbD-like thiol-disulfide interchange protein
MQPAEARLSIVATIAFAAVVLSACSAFADVSAWDGDARAGVRIVSGVSRVESGQPLLRAGVEIRLAPGWKTYWRYPGDSGVPPQFDFSKSENVKSVQVSWPAPERMVEADDIIIGYRNSVLFPLRIEPKDAGKPVVLRLALDYAICEKVCIPTQAKTELTIKSGGTAEPAIAAAEKTVPRTQALGADASLSVKAVHRDDGKKPPRVLVDIAAPADGTLSVFVEGPSGDWALPVPDKVDGAPPGLQRFAFALDGLPPGATGKGATLKVTAVAGTEAIETTFRLD